MNIFEAVTTGDCELILSNISHINLVNEAGNTPLLVAVQKRPLKVVKVLLEHGADKEATNQDGKTALHVAVKHGRIDIVTLLLDHGANIEAANEDGNSSVQTAVLNNHLQMVQLLLKRGTNANTTNKGGTTPLIYAAFYGFEDMVKLLLQHGADHSLGTTEFDNTALFWASKKGHHAIANILLDAESNPFHTIQNGTTVLSTASDELMKRLIREYQRADGPSWLVRELSKRELEWSVVCDTQDKLKKAQITSKHSIVCIPSAQFTDAYLQGIGIDTLTVRCALLDMRAQATWLGARLSSQGMSVANKLLLENFVLEDLCCTSEASFAALPVSTLQNSVLLGRIFSPVVCERLRVVHQKVCEEYQTSISTPAAADHHPPVPSPSVSSPVAAVPTPHLPDVWEENRAFRSIVVKVEHAGMPEVNGTYTCTSMNNNTGVFSRMGQYRGEMVQFILFCQGESESSLIWNIAMIDSFSMKKVPLYRAVVESKYKVPPVGVEWMCVLHSASVSLAPAPSVTLQTPSTRTTPPGSSVTPTTLAMPLASVTEVTVTHAVQASDVCSVPVTIDSTANTPSVACPAGPEDASLQESAGQQEPPLPQLAEGPPSRTESTHSNDSKDDGYMLVKEEWMGALY